MRVIVSVNGANFERNTYFWETCDTCFAVSRRMCKQCVEQVFNMFNASVCDEVMHDVDERMYKMRHTHTDKKGNTYL
jgi:hypothetical protein